MSNARSFVVKLLTKMDENNSYSNILLSDALKKSDLSAQDKKFASALFYGVLERKYSYGEDGQKALSRWKAADERH